MHAPPAVSVQGNGGPLWGGLCAGLPALALAAVLAWLGGLAQQPELGAAAALAGGPALAAWLHGRRLRVPACLTWDGQQWTLDDQEGEVELMLDAQAGWLLRWWPAGLPRRPWHARWFAISMTEAGSRAHLLRVALYGARPRSSAGALQPGAAGRAE